MPDAQDLGNDCFTDLPLQKQMRPAPFAAICKGIGTAQLEKEIGKRG